MNVRWNFPAVLPGDVIRYPLHRSRPIQGHERDDVHETRGFQLGADAFHPVGFELEHAERLAAADHVVRSLVVVGHRRQIELRVHCATDLVRGRFHYR